MKKITAFAAATAMVMSASVATAGGPVIVYEEPVPIVAAEPASSTGIWLPLLGLAIIIGVIASNNNNNNNPA